MEIQKYIMNWRWNRKKGMARKGKSNKHNGFKWPDEVFKKIIFNKLHLNYIFLYFHSIFQWISTGASGKYWLSNHVPTTVLFPFPAAGISFVFNVFMLKKLDKYLL